MPISIFQQEKAVRLSVLAALSITIMLFTVVHFRHFLPARHHSLDCNGFFVSDFTECVGEAEDGGWFRGHEGQRAGKEDWL